MVQRRLVIGIAIYLWLATSMPAVAQSSVTITSLTLPSGVVGTPYTAALTASGGTAPYSWTVDITTLPPGITATGNLPAGSPPQDGIPGSVLYGTPTQAGPFTFSATVYDSSGLPPDTETISVNIAAASGGITPLTVPFSGSNGSMPNSIIQAADGHFYGTTSAGGTTLNKGICFDSTQMDIGCGTVFRLDPNGTAFTITSLVSFSGGSGGSSPTGLIQGPDGNFYGTTLYGGSTVDQATFSCATYDNNLVATNVGCGTIFQVTPSGSLQTMYPFPGAVNGSEKGSFPNPLVAGAGGVVFGTTGACNDPLGSTSDPASACDSSFGILYQFTTPNSGSSSVVPQVLYSFPLSPAYPNSLLVGLDGNLYGTTLLSDDVACPQFFGCGALFAYTPSASGSGSLQTLFDFYQASTEYGNTSSQLNASTASKAVRPFGIVRQPSRGLPTGGASWLLDQDNSRLLEASDGSFFGTTPTAAQFSSTYEIEGSIFHYTPPSGAATAGILDTISLGDWTNGLTAATDGNYYGMADNGIFQVLPSSTSSSPIQLYANLPSGTGTALLQGSDGNFYGASTGGSYGSVFEIEASPSQTGPVTISFSPSSIQVNQPALLKWSVANAFSSTAQQCNAFVQNNASGAGNWSGPQAGTLSNNSFLGSTTITPTAAGSFTYALTCGGTESGSGGLTVTVPPLRITSASLPAADVQGSYAATLNASGGNGTYIWASVAANPLPTGLILSSTGVVSGTPTTSGSFTFGVVASDSEVPPQVANATLSIAVLSQVLAANPNSITISAPGGSGSTTLTFSNFSAGTISVSCSNLPAESSCSTSNLTSTSATLTVTTTAPSSAALEPQGKTSHLSYAMVFPGVLILIWSLKRLRRVTWQFSAVLLLIATSSVLGCGGGSGTPSTKTTDPGTPTGTNTITVTATMGAQNASLQLGLAVQ